QREEEIEEDAGERHHQQGDDEHHRHRQEDLRGAARGRQWTGEEHGHAHASLPPARGERCVITKASTSATAMYSSGGMVIPTRAEPRRARASGRFSTIGTPDSAAIFLIRSAILRCPRARTTGASARSGSYLSATAMWVGLV